VPRDAVVHGVIVDIFVDGIQAETPDLEPEFSPSRKNPRDRQHPRIIE
jgi:hypothetical protein